MKVIFLSHQPHEARLSFARKIDARIKIIPFGKYANLITKYHFLCHFYSFLSLIYSFFVKVEEDILLVDGGSSLYVAAFIKMRKRKLKIIYFDADLLFYNMIKLKKRLRFLLKFSLKMIDAVISVSEQNKNYITKFLDVPIELRLPYLKELKKDEEIIRKNYGLYIGRLDPDKNIKRIIDFAIQCPYFERFIIVGDGGLKGYIREMSKKYKKLIYLGARKDISKYYSECKFLMHIPDSDPHPCTTMEAAVCECYPIISKGVGTSYLFDEMFIINDPDNFSEINNRIKFILDNEQETKRLLKESISKTPTTEQALEDFKDKFKKITEQIYGQKFKI